MSQQSQSAWLRKRAAEPDEPEFDAPSWNDVEPEPEARFDIVPARRRGVAKTVAPERPPEDPAAASPGAGEPSWTDMLDPVALEARLLEARARRAEALARRAEAEGEEAPVARAAPARPRGPGATVVRPTAAPRPVQASEPAAPPPLVADARPVPLPSPRPFWSGPRASLAAIFLVGVIGGGVAVWLLPAALGSKGPEPVRTAAATVGATGAAPVAVSLTAPTTMDEGPAAMAPDAGAAVIGPGGAVSGPPRAAEPGALRPPLAEAAPSKPVVPAGAPDFTGAPPVELAGPAPASGEALPSFARMAVVGGASPEPLGVPDIEAALPDTATRLAAAPVAAKPLNAAAAMATARVFVHFPPGASAEAEAALTALRAAGVSEATLIPGRVSVGSSNVRYFHAADRDAAVAVAGLLAPADGAAPEARDFTGFRPQPNAGLVEVWLAGEAPTGVPTARVVATETRRKPVAAATRAPAAQPVAATSPRVARQQEAEAEAVQRILLERAVERMLKERQPRG